MSDGPCCLPGPSRGAFTFFPEAQGWAPVAALSGDKHWPWKMSLKWQSVKN